MALALFFRRQGNIMTRRDTRRSFLQRSAATVASLQAATLAPAADENNRPKYLCVACGMQYPPSDKPPQRCPICEDERQYVGWDGQQWTTLEQMKGKYRNDVKQEEAGLHSFHTEPTTIGIGQRAFLVQTDRGNLLWDCVPQMDDATIQTIKKLGSIDAIAVSHPHYYTSMVEWSHAFGKAPVYLHQADREWVMRPDPVIRFWEGQTHELFGGLKLVNTGGHFEGFQVLHWPGGASGQGVLLSGDQPQVCRDRRWVSFMYSYPNLIPLPARSIRRIVVALKPLTYDRLYGAFPGLTVASDAKGAVERSAKRYLRAIGA
jgi:hypothetical protein